MIPCYIFDLDGTIANGAHREHHIKDKSPKDWDAYFAECYNDTPILPVVTLLKDLFSSDRVIFIVSARREDCREATEAWFWDRCEIQISRLNGLFMRKIDDYRDDVILKAEILDDIIAHGFEPIMVFDDRARVVKMYRERGLICTQVRDGDF